MGMFSSISSVISSALSSGGSTIGSFGDIVFSASSFKVLTINNYQRKTKARLATHEVIGQKPVVEFVGPDGEEISFTMQFAAGLGVNPAKEADKVRQMCQQGQTAYFMLGNECVGGNKWLISDVSESTNVIDNQGHILVSKLDVTLKEYIESYT